MNEDEENLAVALQIGRWQGDRAPIFIAEQLGVVAVRGDAAGIERWQAIAAAFDALQRNARH